MSEKTTMFAKRTINSETGQTISTANFLDGKIKRKMCVCSENKLTKNDRENLNGDFYSF